VINILHKIPSYFLFRLIGWPRKYPINLTLSVSYKCNSRCKTCNVYERNANELSFDEWKKIFKSLGKNPFWVTISGGEPFLRPDVSKIVCSLYDHCHPAIINIPTNGILTGRIQKSVEEITQHCKQSQIVINLSVDEIGDKHDKIRGISGNYQKVMESYKALKSIVAPNLSIGIHTVISKFNVSRIPEIYQHLETLKPDSYITEIAEEREELDTMQADISPEYQDYVKAVDFLIKKLKERRFGRVGMITRSFRIEYYKIAKKILKEKRQVVPCYAGFASAQIAPDGNVWMCCTKAKSIGSLRDVGYDFKKVWFSEQADNLRKSIKNGECYCPLANASYTNMLHDFKSLSRVGSNFISNSLY